MENTQTKNVFKRQTSPFFNSTMTYLIIMVVFIGIRIFAQFGLLNFLGDFEDLAYSLIIQVGIIFGLTFLCFKSFSKKSAKEIFREFRFKKISFKAVLICIGIGICLIFLNTAFNSIYSLILELFGYAPSSSSVTSYPLYLFLIAIFASAILPGFCEEFANRGMLLSGLKSLGMKKAIVISGLLFGLMHFNVGQFGYAFLVGMFFAFICIGTGSIIPGMIIHFLNNAIVEYLTFARVNDLPLGDFYGQVAGLVNGDMLSSIAIIFIVMFAITFLFGWLTYLLVKEVRTKDIKNISSEIADNLSDADIKPSTPIKIDVPFKVMDCPMKAIYQPTLREKIPMLCAIFLGVVVTIMTLIWGCL